MPGWTCLTGEVSIANADGTVDVLSRTLDAASFSTGGTVHIKGFGIVTTAVGTLTVKLGTATLSTATIPVGDCRFECDVTARTTGASAHAIGPLLVISDGATLITIDPSSVQTVDTTGSLVLKVQGSVALLGTFKVETLTITGEAF